MHTTVFIAILAALTLPFRVRPFEALAWTILTTPVLIFLALQALPVSIPLYWAILLLNLCGWCVFRRNELPENALQIPRERSALLVLMGAMALVNMLTAQWDEFFPMGERLRDYALLSSVIRSPLVLTDPWLHGYGLNYYAFWYRAGNLLSVILQLPPPAMYNQLQALTFGLYLAAIFRICTRFFDWSWTGGLFAALLIGFGSNIDGIFDVMRNTEGWWGPSRVITGAINEFPVWSFLLGDLHPHFLNLSTIPLLLILFLHLTEQTGGAERLASTLITGVCFLIGGALLIYNANAWEVPVWGLALGGILAARILRDLRTREDLQTLSSSLKRTIISPASGMTVLLTMVMAASLWLSSRNILPNPFPARFVKAPIPQTDLFEFLRHWGIPVLALLVSLLLDRQRMLLAAVIITVAIATIFTGTPAPMLWGALLMTVSGFFTLLRKGQAGTTEIVTGVITVVALVLCLVPEYVFLDDPYGGENERMNTIFKMYSSNWFFFHLSALCLARQSAVRLSVEGYVKAAVMISLLLLSSAFFVTTIKERRTLARPHVTAYKSLASVADYFPGGADAVLFLRTQPGTVVLEAQGDAYSWTSFVSTLSDKDSYLGWANHVNLLVRAYQEVTRREQVSARFYTSASCEERRNIMLQEHIDYAVVGSLEFKRHSQARNLDYSCLKEIFSKQEYRIFSVK